MLQNSLNQASFLHLHYCYPPPCWHVLTGTNSGASGVASASVLVHQPVLSLQSCQSELVKHRSNGITQLPVSLQWLPCRIKSNPVPESLMLCVIPTLRPHFLSIPRQSHIRLFLTLNLFPPSYFMFHLPRSLFSKINT